MGSNMGKSSADLHAEADAIGHVSEVVNPARTLARREAQAETGTPTRATPSTPAPGGMSQASFSKSDSKPRSGPPAELLRKHHSR